MSFKDLADEFPNHASADWRKFKDKDETKRRRKALNAIAKEYGDADPEWVAGVAIRKGIEDG